MRGTQLRPVEGCSTAGQGFFNAVAAVPGKPKNVWAVGGTPTQTRSLNTGMAQSWQTVSAPTLPVLRHSCYHSTDIWAMGGTDRSCIGMGSNGALFQALPMSTTPWRYRTRD